MSIELILSVVGTFGTLALTINAFFLRGIFQDLNQVKMELVKIVTKSEAKDIKIMELEVRLKELESLVYTLERELTK